MKRYQDPDIIDMLAAEYALGTLKGRARRRFERLQNADPSLRSEVQAWELRLNNLADSSIPVQPPVDLWSQLEQRLFAESESVPVRWYENLAFWRGLTAGSGFLAAVLALLLIFNPGQSPTANYVVVLNDNTQQPVWTVSSTRDMDQIFVQNLKPLKMGADQGCMLWVQPEGAQSMHALGFLPDDGGDVTVAVDEKLRSWMAKGKLVVTVEPKTQTVPEAPSGQTEFSGRFAPLTKI